MWKPLVSLLIATLPMATQAIEEPSYTVVQRLGEVELREYAAYVVAQVQVSGPADKAGSQAFPILAGYIFGKNKGATRFDMTAPVTQAAAPVKLEMTAPVTQAEVPGGHVVQFVLPKGVTLATALTSLLTGRPVRHDVAMTGEITLRGKVLPVGGIKEKVLGAHRAGIRTVILPKRNEKDLEDIPQEIRAAMQFHFVETVEQVLEHALEPAQDGAQPLRAALSQS